MRRVILSGVVALFFLMGACERKHADRPPDAAADSTPEGGVRAEAGSQADAAAVDGPTGAAEAGPSDALTTGSANGATCSLDTDCRFGHCVEGVCCETACASKCMACVASETGRADGQCAPVKAGVAHSNDCAASGPSTCGLDGKCDGAGACEFFSATTTCGQETCPLAGSTHTLGANCDGRGACKPGTTTSCETYACATDGIRCRTTCASDAECSSTGYCDNGSCKARLDPGKACSRAAQCASGLCGGLCCNAGVPCLCTRESATNVFANAGFDKDLSGWDFIEGDDTWANLDAEKCPFSGSFYSTSANGYPRQCARISPGTKYYAGISVYLVSDAGSTCEIVFYDDNNCTGNATVVTPLFGLGGGVGQWNRFMVEIDATSTSKAALLDCDVNFGYLDQIYLTPVPGGF